MGAMIGTVVGWIGSFAGGLWAKLLPWLLAVVAVLAVVASIYEKGKRAAQDSQAARERVLTINRYKVRDNVEIALQRDPLRPADRLRDDWSRD